MIRGRKWFTSLAHYAKYTTVIARTEPLESAARPHDAFSAIIVPTDTPGYNIVRSVPVFGEIDGDHCEVHYDGVRVPASNLLGKRGQGFRLGPDAPGRGPHLPRHALPRPSPTRLRPDVCARGAARAHSARCSPTSS